MNENLDIPANQHNIWMRGLFMLLMAMILHVAGTVLFVIALIQFVIMLISNTPNVRLASFGRNLGRYFQQIVDFLSCADEEVPFPFNDWPTGG